MEQGIEGNVLATDVKNISFRVVSYLPNGRVVRLLTNRIQGGYENRGMVPAHSGS